MTEQQLIDRFLAECVNDPLRYVMGAFPWSTDKTLQVVPLQGKYAEMFPNCVYGPDIWQCKWLEQWGNDLKASKFNGTMPCDPLRYTTVSGHGVGKTTLSAWIIKFILDTRPFSVGTVTANTAAQLRTKTWAELGKWHLRSITRDRFEYKNSTNEMSLRHVDPTMGINWKCTGYTPDPSNSEAFAGQHASNSTSFYLFDEASNISDKFFEVREGGLVSGQPMTFDFGNGTRNTGRFYENCVGKFAAQYKLTCVDSREAYRSNKKFIADEIKMHGEDSDYVKVRWRGLFPKQSISQFCSRESVLEAMRRIATLNHRKEELFIGVDVARSPTGDESIVYPRVGNDCRSFKVRRFRGLTSHQLAQQIYDYAMEFKAIGVRLRKIRVDGGGGYGGGVIDKLREMGLPVEEVMGGRRAINDKTYALMIDECWGNLRENLPDLLLPDEFSQDGRELLEQLTQRQYSHTLKEQVRLEPKEAYIERMGSSPDVTDALAISFSQRLARHDEWDDEDDVELISVGF